MDVSAIVVGPSIAQAELDRLVVIGKGLVVLLQLIMNVPAVEVGLSVGRRLSADSTFAETWTRYPSLKASSWSNATRKAVVSVFETAPPKEGQQRSYDGQACSI